MSEESEKAEREMNEAVSGAIGGNGLGMALKWVLVVETMNGEGERGVWTFTSEDAKRWEIMGLLAEVEHFQTAHTVAEILEEHRE